MKVKVCGITSIEQMHQLDELGVHYAGMIFYPASQRYARGKIPPGVLLQEKFQLKKVGVFVNAQLDEIKKTIEEYALDIVQLHGDETAVFCEILQKEIPVIKAIAVSDELNTTVYSNYNTSHLLFDNAGTGYGGTGKKFDWELLQRLQSNQSYFLSGGIAPGDAPVIASSNSRLNKKIFAVDINSRFETAPGVKNMVLVKDFIDQLIEHTQTLT